VNLTGFTLKRGGGALVSALGLVGALLCGGERRFGLIQ
jgi:hypothetical protein